jgi:hypothetical protein
VYATSSASEVSGFCAAVVMIPASCRRLITSDQDEPAAEDWTPAQVPSESQGSLLPRAGRMLPIYYAALRV